MATLPRSIACSCNAGNHAGRGFKIYAPAFFASARRQPAAWLARISVDVCPSPLLFERQLFNLKPAIINLKVKACRDEARAASATPRNAFAPAHLARVLAMHNQRAAKVK